MIKLEDKLYTSSEVAQILGVSLRSVYRYIDESKLVAEVKTATGRHRFTKTDILTFLYPDGGVPSEEETIKVTKDKPTTKVKPSPKVEPVEEENVDWLAKFREAAAKLQEEKDSVQKEEPVETETAPKKVEKPVVEEEKEVEPAKKVEPAEEPFTGLKDFASEPEVKVEETNTFTYYRSGLGGLKDIAQNLDKSARNSSVGYAFTLNAGLSLHKPIKPFSLLHSYVKPSDVLLFERVLMLSPSDQANAQICLISTKDQTVFDEKEEMHGLFVVSKPRLKSDIDSFGSDYLKEDSVGILA